MTAGKVVECIRYTPGISTGALYIVVEEFLDMRGHMLVVREYAKPVVHPPYWAWRFRPAMGEARN